MFEGPGQFDGPAVGGEASNHFDGHNGPNPVFKFSDLNLPPGICFILAGNG
jgi:hypothetical protein